jgi:photosystem II oxygen-evolving enhancer protein 1
MMFRVFILLVGITSSIAEREQELIGISDAPAQALTFDELNDLSYLQVKGTGLANRCAEVKGTGLAIKPKSGAGIVNMCIEPKAWAVEETIGKGGDFLKKKVNVKVMTRQTYTLDDIEGTLSIIDGRIIFEEKGGIDYVATTVQLPGGERVPFLFTVKNLVAKGSGDTFKPGFQMGGDFTVPSYRTGLFLDPKGRGGTTGYDTAVALPGHDELFEENNQTFDVPTGRIEMEVNTVNKEESEIGGVFVATQLGDNDMGSKIPKKIITTGIWYAKVQ